MHVVVASGYTAIPYRASTGPEQGFPCVVFPHREKPVFISWEPCNGNRFFPDGNTTQGKPSLQGRGLQCVLFKDKKFYSTYIRANSMNINENVPVHN